MARSRRKLDIHGQADEVLKLFKTTKPGWEKERLQSIKLGLENKLTNKEIAQTLGRHVDSINNWFNLFREGGIQKLLSKDKGNGPEMLLNEEQMNALKQGLQEGRWRTGPQAYRWLSETYGISFHPNSIYKYLKKLGGRLKVARPSHKKKNLNKVAEFKEQLTQKMIDLRLDPKRPVRLWVYDEMRYGLAPVTRRMWTLRGHEIIAPVHHRYEYGYLYGAIQVGGSGSEFYLSPTVNKEVDAMFLKQISDRDPYANHIVIGDGAGFHHKEGQDNESKIPDNIHILTLPPYSPELNPSEQLWDIIKDGICNIAYDNMDALETALIRELKRFWEDGRKAFTLIGDGYLLTKLNVI